MIKAAEKASKSVIRDFGEVERLQVSKKGPYDFVTKTDKHVEKILIEEFLDGIELSCFVLTDGSSYLTLPMAKDYKRIGEGDTGLNTGGMGAVSPVPFVTEEFKKKIDSQIVRPTIEGIQKDEKIENSKILPAGMRRPTFVFCLG